MAPSEHPRASALSDGRAAGQPASRPISAARSLASSSSANAGPLLKRRVDSNDSSSTSLLAPRNKRPGSARASTATRPVTGNSARPTTARPTTAASTLGGLPANAWICAVLENRGTGREVGIAMMEKETGHCILTQASLSLTTYVKTVHHLTLHSPAAILAPATAVSSIDKPDPQQRGKAHESSVLVRTLEDSFSLDVVPINRRDWDSEEGGAHAGRSEIHGEATTRSAILTAIGDRYYALSAACALFKYLERINNRAFASRSLRIRYAAPEGTILINTECARNLELVSNSIERKSKNSLLGVLDHTRTPMAARLLTMNLLAPMTDQSAIQSRLDAITEIVGEEERSFALRESMAPLGNSKVDLDKLINQLLAPEPRVGAGEPSRTENKIGQLLSLDSTLKSLGPVRAALSGARSGLLRAIRAFISGNSQLDEIMDLCADSINPDLFLSGGSKSLSSRNARLYAIKAAHSPLLDVARETYKENMGDIHDLARRYSESYKLDVSLKSAATGFSLSGAESIAQRDLPSEFTNVLPTKNGKSLTFSSLPLKKCNQRLNDSLNEVLLLSAGLVEDLREQIVMRVAGLYKASEAVALLDMLVSLAHNVQPHRLVRPEFTGALAIKGGRHPILDVKIRGGAVPNDAYVAGGQSFFLITGPNHSGKTTYLRQIAMLQIMASIGSFVPADYASFIPDLECILTRLSNDDDQEANLSTFANEMRAASFVLSLASKRSLVLIDELGRGTSPQDGIGIAQAISEELIAIEAPTFFATHFQALPTTLAHLPGVSSQHLAVGYDSKVRDDFNLVFHHRLTSGACKEPHYGIAMARSCCLPPRLLERATEMAELLEHDETAAAARQQSSKVLLRRNEVLRLQAQLSQAVRHCTLPDMRPFLFSIQASRTTASRCARLTRDSQRDFVSAMTAAYAEDEEMADGQDASARLAREHEAAQVTDDAYVSESIVDDGHVSESIVEDDSQEHSDAIDDD
ncbi:hypothetical protein FA09DRAFT_296615 [Tilletiopsis washingtonensis]|uniref:DNA mismatch repair protein MSH3 n=1 Tax=Tilletiopsis washingtonensis TaxID=58919 RepID=A0A316ZC35_9BASI|nr:hypothetical protein FA09DRAFT_296615 [Tilletiopsis washingtonensis]PWN98876.1 hypothetical protein FA09DRAFT_296615 [Tilletiopsis washingtonensis]